MRKIKVMMLYYLPIYPPTYLSVYYYTFYMRVLGNGGDKENSVALPFSPVLWNALYVIRSHTLINQYDKCPAVASTYRSHRNSMWLCI